MSLNLKPIFQKIEEINTTGVPFQTPEGCKTLKAQLLIGIFDLPAKAMAMNWIQFNRRYVGLQGFLNVYTHLINGRHNYCWG